MLHIMQLHQEAFHCRLKFQQEELGWTHFFKTSEENWLHINNKTLESEDNEQKILNWCFIWQ